MDRRHFLRVGAAGASGLMVLGESAVAGDAKFPGGKPSRIAMPDMDAYLAQMDEGMAAISRWSPSSVVPDFTGDRDAVDDLARKSLRTLYMTGMFSDLPDEGQRHPGIQKRLFEVMPEMDEATSGMAAFLSTRSTGCLKNVQSALRDPSNPAMEIFDALDRGGAGLALSSQRRIQTRMMITQAGWRLRNQPPSLVIAETLDKIERAGAADITDEAKRDWIAGRVGEELFWRRQQAGDSALLGAEDPAEDSKEASNGSSEGVKRHESLQDQRISRGARLMGIGLVVGGLAVAGTAVGIWPLVFVATVGAVMIVIGVLILLVGLLTPGEPHTSTTSQ